MEQESIQTLSREVRDYYLGILSELPVTTQFHFLSRAYLWTHKNEYYQKLLAIRESWWVDFERAKRSVVLCGTSERTFTKGKEYRRPYKNIYGDILRYNRFFFMCLFDRSVFNGAAFEEHSDLLNKIHHRELYEKLKEDPEALHALSTMGVNFLMLSHHFFPELPSPYESLRIAIRHPIPVTLPDMGDATAYFGTHVVIGASLFYAREIPADMRPLCLEMLKIAEDVIRASYDLMSLDHKCELLVCAELCGVTSPLASEIQSELLASVAPSASYFINIHNAHKKPDIPTPKRKEHTNILALMAFLGREGL